MKNTFLILTFLTVCFLGNKVSGQTVTPLTTAEFKEKIWNFETDKDWKYKGDKPAIIDMYATWCGPCKRLAPILEEIQKITDRNCRFTKLIRIKKPNSPVYSMYPVFL